MCESFIESDIAQTFGLVFWFCDMFVSQLSTLFIFSSRAEGSWGAYRMVLEPAFVPLCVHIFKDLL